MPRKPVRDWLTTEEAAAFIGVSIQRFRDFMTPAILPHSEPLTRGWLHYKGDLEKLKAEREKNPPRVGRKKMKKDAPKNPPRKRGRPRKSDSDGAQAGNFPAENRPVTEDAAAPREARKMEVDNL